eukprot:4138050-Prymnesium_polylepis.1
MHATACPQNVRQEPAHDDDGPSRWTRSHDGRHQRSHATAAIRLPRARRAQLLAKVEDRDDQAGDGRGAAEPDHSHVKGAQRLGLRTLTSP